MKKAIFLLFASILTSALFAQVPHQAVNKKEKILKLAKEAIERYESDNTNTINSNINSFRNVKQSNTEQKILNENLPESEVHAAINPNDSNYIVVSPMLQGNGLEVPIYFSSDFGKTWSTSSFSAEPDFQDNVLVIGGGDPNFAYDANGKLYFSWINLFVPFPSADSIYWGLYWASSTNNGKTWQRANNSRIAFSRGEFSMTGNMGLSNAYDKQWMMVDQTNSQYKNTLYVCMVDLNIQNSNSTIIVKRKLPNNEYFEASEGIVSDQSFTSVQFSSIDIDDSGYVHVTFYGEKSGEDALWHAISKDGGQTFPQLKKITEIQMPTNINGIDNDRLYPSPYTVIDKSNTSNKGNIYVSFTASGIETTSGNANDVYLARSTDNGYNWSKPFRVHDDAEGISREQFYSTLMTNNNGVLTVCWYDGRYAANNVEVNYMSAFSFDGGQSFTGSFSVSGDKTNFSTVGNQNNGFGIGEYNQVLMTDGYALPVWADGRTNDGRLDIYIAFSEITRNPAGVKELATINTDFSVSDLYPVPASEVINFNINLKTNTNVQIEIIDQTGKVLMHRNFTDLPQGETPVQLNLDRIAQGVYFCKVSTNSDIRIKEFIVQ
jgi:hypothetical protein